MLKRMRGGGCNKSTDVLFKGLSGSLRGFLSHRLREMNRRLSTSSGERRWFLENRPLMAQFRSRRSTRCSSAAGTTLSEVTEEELEEHYCTDDSLESAGEDDGYLCVGKAGEKMKVSFYHDYVNIDGLLLLYENIIYWCHTEKYLKLSYLEANQKRVDLKLFPLNGVDPAELVNHLQMKIAALVRESTGCAFELALVEATKSASKRDVSRVLEAVETKLIRNQVFV